MRKEEWQLRLQHPAPSARNRTRWWWYGCAVEEAEIIRELDEMQAAGLGGIELQILYSLQADDPKKTFITVNICRRNFWPVYGLLHSRPSSAACSLI